MPENCRHPETRIIDDVFSHLGHGGRFQPQVHFKLNRALQGFDRLYNIQPAGFGGKPLRQSGRGKEGLQIVMKPGFNPGPQHLDRDIVLVSGLVHYRGLVDLCNRGCCHRVGQGQEYVTCRFAQPGLDGFARPGHVERLHAVLQLTQGICALGSDHVRPRGQKLAKLDVAWPQFVQRLGQRRCICIVQHNVETAKSGDGATGTGKLEEMSELVEHFGWPRFSSRNGWQRYRLSACGGWCARIQPLRSCVRKAAAREISGCSRQDTGTDRHRR